LSPSNSSSNVVLARFLFLKPAIFPTRVEERRQAHMKAASELNCAKLRWEALPNEARAQQQELDNLVLEVEGYLEATLPPASKDDHNGKDAPGAPPGTAPPDKKGKAKKGDDDDDQTTT
jgi:hypothetical protein